MARVYGPERALRTAPLPFDQEGIVYAEIDLADIDIAKTFADPVGHYSRPDVFAVTVDRTPRTPAVFAGEQAPVEESPLELRD